jgi:hypothetical protein
MDLEPVRQCCQRLLAHQGLEAVHDEVRRIGRRLDEPLCVAVSGRVSAGKSTLVNALIGRRIAPMGEGEVTEANCWFRHVDYAEPPGDERAIVRRPKPNRAAQPGPDGELATETEEVPVESLETLGGIEVGHTEAITVYLNVDILRDLTVVDTPGLFSPNREKSERTEKLLRDRTVRAAKRADAVIYMTTFLSADDVGELEEFSLLASAVAQSPTNALLLMNAQWGRDAQGSGPDPAAGSDPLAQGQAHVESHADWMRPLVWDQRVVFAPLAEVACTREGMSEQVVADLRAVANSKRKRSLLDSPDGFRRPDRLPDVPVERREELIRRFQLFGLHEAVRLIEQDGSSEAELRKGLLAASGFKEVSDLVYETFRARNNLLLADSVLAQLEELALLGRANLAKDLSEDAEELMRDEIDKARKKATNEFRRLRALRLSMDQEIPFDPEARRELRSLFSEEEAEKRVHGVRGTKGRSRAERYSKYALRAGVLKERWQAVAGSQTSPARRRVANQAVDSYEELERHFHRAAVAAEKRGARARRPAAPAAAVSPGVGKTTEEE